MASLINQKKNNQERRFNEKYIHLDPTAIQNIYNYESCIPTSRRIRRNQRNHFWFLMSPKKEENPPKTFQQELQQELQPQHSASQQT